MVPNETIDRISGFMARRNSTLFRHKMSLNAALRE
jgi:hypothetical protein